MNKGMIGDMDLFSLSNLVYAVIGLVIVYFVVYKILIQNMFVIEKRLIQVVEVTDPTRIEDDRDILEKYIDSGMLYKVPLLGNFYKKQIESLKAANIPMKPKEYVLATIGVFLIFLVAGTVVTGQVIFGVLLGVIGLILPNVYVGHLKRKRTEDLDEQLPEFLNTLGNGLRSGLSLNQAIDIASAEAPDPVGWEFSRVLSDMNKGRTVEMALENLKERTNNENIDLLVNAIIVQREVGGNLSEILDVLAETIRGNAKLQRYFKSTVAQNKLSGMIIGFLPIAIGGVLMVISPEYMTPLFTETIGIIMLVVGVSMMGLGLFIIFKITDLEV